MWSTQKRILEQVLLSAKMLLSSLEESVNFIDDEFDNTENFLQSRIRTVIFQKLEKEVEVQNAIEALLLGRGLAKGIIMTGNLESLNFLGKSIFQILLFPKYLSVLKLNFYGRDINLGL
ncbi:MAG: hypothetical protein NC089_01890 [Bacteroides sp.]|nr:hypothetical protein [Bacteroides sp.]MCM1548876.1 hypothetical protein [Clostridium sp.]